MLACNMHSLSRVQTSWLRRLNELEAEPVRTEGDKYAQVGHLLLINRLNRNDSGTYICQAKNVLGEERLEMELSVRGEF